uniref:Macaca fascicularis brain cDNA clone: QflA-19443, similar to human protein kinase, cAMP-dependent, catalytic, beta(PRKACB), transcript variant 2, mRNA, RefSeq: NM_002731.2 n=1 Tax=Macaca fascicularis TaxID=9541 RepID=I7GCK1_MACFA|nr:unnamed protein product [Macaca fascicularis]
MYIIIPFALLSVQVGHSHHFFSSVPHPCKTFEDIKKSCLRCSFYQSICLSVIKCFCMVMSRKC